MKKHTIKTLATLVTLLITLNSYSWNISVNWNVNGQILTPLNGFPINSSVPMYKIASITSDADCNNPFETFNSLNFLVTLSRNDMFITSTPMTLYIHNIANGAFDVNTATPVKTGAAALALLNRSIGLCPTAEYEIWFGFNLNQNTSNCQWMKFQIITVDAYGSIKYDDFRQFYFSNYATNWSEWNTPDLFIKDNDKDYGAEPNWQSNTANITKSVSIRNTLSGSVSRLYSGINPELALPNYAQRSTLGNYNSMNVWVENRGCVASTATAKLNVYWSVARLWERWGKDWHNYSTYDIPADAINNFANWTDPSTSIVDQVPLGNHITLTDKNDYKSLEKSIIIPSGLTYSTTNGSNQWQGGHLSSTEWNPPSADWYTGASTIFRNAGRPVLCYLAVIDEPSKPNNGFFQNFNPRSGVSILDYAMLNNNVATVNSFLATPSRLYKTALPKNKYRSEIGIIRIDNPTIRPSLPISIKLDSGVIDFRNNGTVFAIFDEILWDRWSQANFEGSGFEIVSPQVVKITNQYIAKFNGITLGKNESGMLGIQFEYDGNNTPKEDYNFHLSVGLSDNTSENNQIGTPTHFITNVLKTPMVDETETLYKTNLKKDGALNFDFLNIYPNPVSDKLNIMFELKKDASLIAIEIYDIQLKLIKKITPLDLNKGGKQYSIPTDDLANGSYLLKLNIDNSYQTHKFVK